MNEEATDALRQILSDAEDKKATLFAFLCMGLEPGIRLSYAAMSTLWSDYVWKLEERKIINHDFICQHRLLNNDATLRRLYEYHFDTAA